jgi:ABC-type polysaccharide/polyol phosphate transport system ATPase subunit
MGEEIAISLMNVSKSFKRYARPVDRLKELLLPGKSYAQEFWAVSDVSFDIIKGETMGIIGRNGAGKSTLLQLICGTLTPTSGQVQVNGKVSALLELGAGFNPEFTGRENVYINGAIMGLSRQDVDKRYDNIAAFADIGDFINQPVKTYSSGMYVRLAFAAAIHVDPDILIVDEALAVGDMFFQAKCMARMRQMMDAGVTVLFVSHDTSAVRSFCQRCAFFANGKLKEIGKASEVVASYMGTLHEEMNQELKREINIQKSRNIREKKNYKQDDNLDKISEIYVSTTQEVELAKGFSRYGDGDAKVLDIKLLNSQHIPTNELEFNEEFTIQASIRFDKSLPTFCFGYLIRDIKGIDIIGTVSTVEKLDLPAVELGDIYIVEIKVINVLNAGVYSLTFAVELPVVTNEQHIYLDWVNDAVIFNVNYALDPLERFTSKVYIPAKINYLQFKPEVKI